MENIMEICVRIIHQDDRVFDIEDYNWSEDLKEEFDNHTKDGGVVSVEYWDMPDFGNDPDFGKIWEFLSVYEALHPNSREALIVWADYNGASKVDYSDFEDQYVGTYCTAADYAEELLAEEVARPLGSRDIYFDYAACARDMEMGGSITVLDVGQKVAIFAE